MAAMASLGRFLSPPRFSLLPDCSSDRTGVKLLCCTPSEFSTRNLPTLTLTGQRSDCGGVIAKAAAETLIATAEPVIELADTVSTLEIKSEADMLKKKMKKLRLRRKRLLRKRHLRKKGKWPPSKVAKTKNV